MAAVLDRISANLRWHSIGMLREPAVCAGRPTIAASLAAGHTRDARFTSRLITVALRRCRSPSGLTFHNAAAACSSAGRVTRAWRPTAPCKA